MSVVQGFSGNSQEILTGDFPCLHKPGSVSSFIFFCARYLRATLNGVEKNYLDLNERFVYI